MQAEQLTRALEAGDFETAERVAVEYGDRVATSGNAAVLQQALDTRSGGRLHLDPGTAS